ncbi:MAG TPA: hypothetical protein VN258_16575 [Mobilitalea sp.]|nr:hypothetical protein [Mobilitalea sp.]
MIPVKKSKGWIIIFICYAVIIFAALFITRVLISSEYLSSSIPGMVIISLCSALIPCIGGYFGRQIFFTVYSLAVIIGISYALYIAIGDTAPGWGTLTSIIGYLFIVFFGIVIGFIGETIYSLIRIRDKAKNAAE